mmetsp:Transcript_8198/g.20155  ORF Transcript_8198/g.20155 Transcript_8198/m.20155 type:complete len:128 (-) Transcript_8198:345-728(-)
MDGLIPFYSGFSCVILIAFLAVYLVKGEISPEQPVEILTGDDIKEGGNKGSADSDSDSSNNPPVETIIDTSQAGETPKDKNHFDNGRGWRCACEGGGIFLPQSLMKSIAGPSAAMRLGAGGCYHKQM